MKLCFYLSDVKYIIHFVYRNCEKTKRLLQPKLRLFPWLRECCGQDIECTC